MREEGRDKEARRRHAEGVHEQHDVEEGWVGVDKEGQREGAADERKHAFV